MQTTPPGSGSPHAGMGHGRGLGDRPVVSPGDRVAGVRGVSSRAGHRRDCGVGELLRRLHRDRSVRWCWSGAGDADLASQSRLGALLGYDADALDQVNKQAVDLVRRIARASDVSRALVSGVIGPRGDGYVAAGHLTDEAADYHQHQLRSLAQAGVDVAHAMTLSEPAEAVGIVQAARSVGVMIGISFTVEPDGRLPDGTPLGRAIEIVDAQAAPDWYGVNCAHPTHVLPALDGGAWQSRLRLFRPNASTLTHAELDVMEELDTGDRELLSRTTAQLLLEVPSITTLGGCCGTDASHVAELWGLPPSPFPAILGG